MITEYIAVDARSDAAPLIYFMVGDILYFQPLENKGTNDKMYESSYSLKTLLDRDGVRGWIIGVAMVNQHLMMRELLK